MELKVRTEEKHPTEDFKKILREFIESLSGGKIFYKEFIAEDTKNNIYPDEKDTTDERQGVYRRDRQILQWAFIRKDQQESTNDSYVHFIPYFNVRVSPNTEIVNDSSNSKLLERCTH